MMNALDRLSLQERVGFTAPNRVVILGATGLARMVKPMLARLSMSVAVVYDRDMAVAGPWPSVPMVRSRDALALEIAALEGRDATGSIVAIAAPNGRVRLEFQDWLETMGVRPVTLLHSTAHMEDNASVGEGVLVLARALVSTDVVLHGGAIVGEGSIIGHDSVLDRGAQTGPGAVLCGGVELGECAWVGANATILPGLRIGADAIVGAGSVVTKDVPPGVTVRGMAAHIWEKAEPAQYPDPMNRPTALPVGAY